MADKFITLRIDEKVHQKYKVICAEYKILMGKQTSALIEAFVETQERNLKLFKEARKE
jgi:hypothetical protein